MAYLPWHVIVECYGILAMTCTCTVLWDTGHDMFLDCGMWYWPWHVLVEWYGILAMTCYCRVIWNTGHDIFLYSAMGYWPWHVLGLWYGILAMTCSLVTHARLSGRPRVLLHTDDSLFYPVICRILDLTGRRIRPGLLRCHGYILRIERALACKRGTGWARIMVLLRVWFTADVDGLGDTVKRLSLMMKLRF